MVLLQSRLPTLGGTFWISECVHVVVGMSGRAINLARVEGHGALRDEGGCDHDSGEYSELDAGHILEGKAGTSSSCELVVDPTAKNG
jgi:hypothetical protein